MFKADKKHMHMAIEDAMQSLGDEGGGPFGACIVENGQVIATAQIRYWKKPILPVTLKSTPYVRLLNH